VLLLLSCVLLLLTVLHHLKSMSSMLARPTANSLSTHQDIVYLLMLVNLIGVQTQMQECLLLNYEAFYQHHILTSLYLVTCTLTTLDMWDMEDCGGLLKKKASHLERLLTEMLVFGLIQTKTDIATIAEISWKYVGTLSGTSENWLCYATNPKNSKIFPYRQIAQICSTTQIAPPDAASSVTIVGSDAIGALMLDGTPVAADHSDEPIPPSENDFSIGLLVRYGRFSYGTFGDTDGEYETSVNGYYYDDIEAVVGPRIGHVDVYRVNHHGSSHSSSPGFLGTLTPSASIISCGYNNSYGHPDQEIVDRLLGYGSLYITEKGNLMNNYGTAVIASGDIVITSTDGGNTFTITAGSSTKTFTSRGAVPPKCVVQHHNRL